MQLKLVGQDAVEQAGKLMAWLRHEQIRGATYHQLRADKDNEAMGGD
jgi:hypothetical protein